MHWALQTTKNTGQHHRAADDLHFGRRLHDQGAWRNPVWLGEKTSVQPIVSRQPPWTAKSAGRGFLRMKRAWYTTWPCLRHVPPAPVLNSPRPVTGCLRLDTPPPSALSPTSVDRRQTSQRQRAQMADGLWLCTRPWCHYVWMTQLGVLILIPRRQIHSDQTTLQRGQIHHIMYQKLPFFTAMGQGVSSRDNNACPL